MEQRIILLGNDYQTALNYLRNLACRHALLVHGSSLRQLAVGQMLLNLPTTIGIEVTEFTDFHPNPDIESAVKGAELCIRKQCDLIIACGGGSAMDVAKCIRLFVAGDIRDVASYDEKLLMKHTYMPFVAVPTTAGTGSEATCFAVAYRQGKKISVVGPHNIPQTVIYDCRVLDTLPSLQKQATFADAMCHAMEAYWSKGATSESRLYSREAIRLLIASWKYVQNEGNSNYNLAMFLAAYYAGKAINIAKTTAAHAMCYGLTKQYGLAHGQAAGRILLYIGNDLERKAKDNVALQQTLQELATMWGEEGFIAVMAKWKDWLTRWGMLEPLSLGQEKEMAERLLQTVNVERMQNHPVKLSQAEVTSLYKKILQGKELLCM
ncbi:phosphonoacetaldehyde reductase [Selenomonas ruminantium]|uniref:phosphonoacetaldehyde reductase n=1 Tax=Selenomonas ruminantium TaxID=971 RepID=UPI0026EA9922|nr:phosphonoacetaldehyde reductase [Selenomonas ruminantium]